MDPLFEQKERVLYTQEWAALVQGQVRAGELGFFQRQKYYDRLQELELKLFGAVY